MIDHDVQMTNRSLRLLAVAAAAFALLVPATALAAPAGIALDRGVVQSVDPGHIVLRSLDGSTASFDVVPSTRVRVNGHAAAIGQIAPGYVADVIANRRHRAILIRAFGKPVTTVTTDRGIVAGRTKASLSLALDSGGSVTIPLDAGTRVRSGGSFRKRSALRPGTVVSVTHAAGGPALVITIVKRAGA